MSIPQGVKLRPSKVPTVLFVAVSRKALRLAVRTGTLVRISGKPLAMFERPGRVTKKSGGGSKVILRISARAAAERGSRFYDRGRGRIESHSVPLKFAACPHLPTSIAVPRIDAAGGVVVTAGPRPRVLLLLKKTGSSERWVLPKGKRGRSERRRNAARREVLEESGLERVDVGPFLLREHYFDRERGRMVFKEVSYFLMRCPKGRTRLRANRAEGFTRGQWASFRTALVSTDPVRAHHSIMKAQDAVGGR
jgi:8-oxo-dGTP pyrophosphatase MutT (NUDIX family)